MRNLHGFDACVCFSLLHFCGVECISKSVFLLVCPFLFVKHALRSREIWHLFKGLRKLFCSFASTLTTWSYPKLLFHFSNSPLSSLFSLLDHCCSLSLSFCSFTNTMTGTYADALTFIFLHQQKKKSCFFSPISSYMEAISPLPCRLLRTGLFFLFLPVLIRMSAGSVTCNLSTKPQQFHRDGKYSHNDIILDWDKVSRHDRKLEFSSPVRIPLFFFPPDIL